MIISDVSRNGVQIIVEVYYSYNELQNLKTALCTNDLDMSSFIRFYVEDNKITDIKICNIVDEDGEIYSWSISAGLFSEDALKAVLYTAEKYVKREGIRFEITGDYSLNQDDIPPEYIYTPVNK